MTERLKETLNSSRLIRQLNELSTPFINVQYNAAIIPSAKHKVKLTQGANCQVYAYQLLGHYGLDLDEFPAFRSSELWNDNTYTRTVADDAFQHLDLMLYNKTTDPYGAHVGIYLEKQRILHLSQSAGHPVIQTHSNLLSEDKYCCFIGAKRVSFNRRLLHKDRYRKKI